ncbi:MAG: methylated-DNA--[protein]-cysteine S-methyltransferase [Methanobacteriota archaeon]
MIKSAKKRTIWFAVIPSGEGKTFVAATEKGICKLHWPDSPELRRRVEKNYDCVLVEDPDRFEKVRRQLDEYHAGKRKEFDLSIDFVVGTDFQKRIWKLMLKIPYGKTRTYGWMAEHADSPRGCRAAGQAIHNNPIPIIVPCHRVVGKDGSMTGYGGPSESGKRRKRELLVMEGALKE